MQSPWPANRRPQLLFDLGSLCPAGSERNTSRDRLGITQLDDLLDVFMRVPSTQHLPRPQSPARGGQTLLSDDEDTADTGDLSSLVRVARADPVVEISSSSSAAGKSQLLYYLTAVAVLPSAHEGVDLGGRDSAVVFIDADARFDADRLQMVARGIAQQKLGGQAGPALDLDPILAACLRHVHVFRPQSSSSLLATLQDLDTYLLDVSRHVSSERPLHAILIDSASAFFWQDKLRDEVSRVEDIGRPLAELERDRQQKQSFHLSDLYAELAKELKRLQRRFSCAVIYTTISWSGKPIAAQHDPPHPPSGPFDLYSPPTPSAPKTPSLRPSLPSPWGTFPTLRLVVQRDAVRPFPPGMTVSDAERDAPMRHEVVMQGKFSGWVNSWGREEWPSRIVEGVERTGGMFVFYVRGHGVDIR